MYLTHLRNGLKSPLSEVTRLTVKVTNRFIGGGDGDFVQALHFSKVLKAIVLQLYNKEGLHLACWYMNSCSLQQNVHICSRYSPIFAEVPQSWSTFNFSILLCTVYAFRRHVCTQHIAYSCCFVHTGVWKHFQKANHHGPLWSEQQASESFPISFSEHPNALWKCTHIFSIDFILHPIHT